MNNQTNVDLNTTDSVIEVIVAARRAVRIYRAALKRIANSPCLSPGENAAIAQDALDTATVTIDNVFYGGGVE